MIGVLSCSKSDIPELARLNRMLIEDEKADSTMTVAQLERRMKGFLASGYQAYFFMADTNRVGYALVDIAKTPLYLRHFFICRDSRRKGHGREAFFALLAHLDVREMDLDVFLWNHRGIAFWKSLGFLPRSFSMRFKK